MKETQESLRLQEEHDHQIPWKKWGPYLSERQWGTVREDYSPGGDAWDYFTHDQARSRAYRWGEDGIAGISDDRQQLCFALAMWNGSDPILKERLYGLTNSEGNHGEDVKEYYYYLDSTPTHSYMKYLYKYPQKAFPYDNLIQNNRSRTRNDMEYELIDTGVFDDDRYFDVFIEYAKQTPDDLLIQITAFNRGPQAATLYLVPTLWFRNIWWGSTNSHKPQVNGIVDRKNLNIITASHEDLGKYYLYCDKNASLLFTENETNTERIFGIPNAEPYVKDGINNFIVNGQQDAVNPQNTGTKAAALYQLKIDPRGSQVVRLRLTNVAPEALEKAYPRGNPLKTAFTDVITDRQKEADEFYEAITPETAGKDEATVMRQALGGMLWTKQFYSYEIDYWLQGHGVEQGSINQNKTRNGQWFHMINNDVISMPDKWEYPWYAAWDLAFHTIALSLVDMDFAKSQINLVLNELYLHPNGQLPAYEWNFSDVNPPVHAWATYYLYNREKDARGKGDLEFLKQAFQKLLLNFTWWVNRKDRNGSNVFEGGFLGLDNIGVFDRSSPLPNGGYLEQADGTAWMALFAQNMFQISLELAMHDPSYEEMALKFLEHFLWIASAMDRIGENGEGMWDEQDGFFYDLLRFPDGGGTRLKVRSMVGLLPLCASTVIPIETVQRFPRLIERTREFHNRRSKLLNRIAQIGEPGVNNRRLLAVLNEENLTRVLAHMLDENEFLSPYGIRSISRYHADHPYIYNMDGQEVRVDYVPAESNTGMFGGNSNWRGPIWMPVNVLLVRALLNLYSYYGDDFTVECPTGSGKKMTLFQVSQDIERRLENIFLCNKRGQRPVFGGAKKFQTDPNWMDYLLFYEYFHGDNGAGLGASHQTGWTGLIAAIIDLNRTLKAEDILSQGLISAKARRTEKEPQI